MIRKELVILNKLGLHARAAAKFVKCASCFASEITIAKDAIKVNGKSIIGVLLLAAPRGSQLILEADGSDEEAAAAAVVALVSDRFGED